MERQAGRSEAVCRSPRGNPGASQSFGLRRQASWLKVWRGGGGYSGGGKLWRSKLGVLAGFLNIKSLDEFAERYGPKWAYRLQPAIAMIDLPHYEDMKLAKRGLIVQHPARRRKTKPVTKDRLCSGQGLENQTRSTVMLCGSSCAAFAGCSP